MAHLYLLPDELWAHTVAGRSTELNTIYVERFRGPRTRRTAGSHGFWEISCVVAGHGDFCVPAREPVVMQPDRAFLIPPGLPHDELSAGSLDTIWLAFDGSLLQGLPRELQYVDASGLTSVCMETWAFVQRRHARCGPEIDGRCRRVLGLLWRLSVGRRVADADVDVVGQAIERLNEGFGEPLSIAALAASLGVSEGHFHRLFRRATGQTPLAYLTQLRLQHAAHWLVYTDLPIAQVAALAGYSDPHYFSKAFRKHMHQTPSAFRACPNAGS